MDLSEPEVTEAPVYSAVKSERDQALGCHSQTLGKEQGQQQRCVSVHEHCCPLLAPKHTKPGKFGSEG